MKQLAGDHTRIVGAVFRPHDNTIIRPHELNLSVCMVNNVVYQFI